MSKTPVLLRDCFTIAHHNCRQKWRTQFIIKEAPVAAVPLYYWSPHGRKGFNPQSSTAATHCILVATHFIFRSLSREFVRPGNWTQASARISRIYAWTVSELTHWANPTDCISSAYCWIPRLQTQPLNWGLFLVNQLFIPVQLCSFTPQNCQTVSLHYYYYHLYSYTWYTALLIETIQ